MRHFEKPDQKFNQFLKKIELKIRTQKKFELRILSNERPLTHTEESMKSFSLILRKMNVTERYYFQNTPISAAGYITRDSIKKYFR